MVSYSQNLFDFINGELYPYFNLQEKTLNLNFEFRNCGGKNEKVNIVQIDFKRYGSLENELFKKIKSVEKKFFKNYAKLILHGSFATYDYTQFSDIDLLLILDIKNCDIKKIKWGIKKILFLIFSYDYTQHHGIFTLPVEMLNCYPEWFLPISTFKRAKSFSDKLSLNFSYYSDINFSKMRLLKFLDSLMLSYKSKIYLKNGYNFKHFASRILLLPALFLEIKGKNLYKRDSFKIFYDLGHDKFGVIEFFSEVRENWKRKGGIFPPFEIFNPWLFHKINRKFFSSIEKHISTDILKDLSKLKIEKFLNYLRSEVENI